MKTLYIHIGHYKTGTSAIQQYCSTHADLLAANGFLYPATGRPKDRTNHANLSLPLAARHGFVPPSWYNANADVDQAFAEFRAEATAARQPNVLISSEEFLQLGLRADPRAAVADLRDRLEGFDVRVLFYIRDPMALLKSWYNQVNKGPYGTRTFPVFFKNLAPGFLSQAPVYRAFADTFGADRMILRGYRHAGMDHIRDFLGAIGYAPLPSETDPLSVNEAQDLDMLEMSRLAKERTHSYEQATLSQFGDIRALDRRVKQINTDFASIGALADPPIESSLSLAEIFRHLQALVAPLKARNCVNKQEAVIMRKAAVSVEDSDPELALALMRVAQIIRPKATFINRKVAEYEARIAEPGEGT